MPKKLWNVDHQPHVIDWSERAVMPGEPYEFTDEQVAAGLAGNWSEQDPRAGLEAERAFKKRRDAPVQELNEVVAAGDKNVKALADLASAAEAAKTTNDPAEPGDNKE